MICKWCGATADVTKGICDSCGRELPALSDCGGFYDIVPEAVRKASEPVRNQATTQEMNSTVPVQPMMPPPVIQVRSRGRGLLVVALALALVVVVVFTVLLASANHRNNELEEEVESCKAEIDRLKDTLAEYRRTDEDDKKPNHDAENDREEESSENVTDTIPYETDTIPAETNTEPSEEPTGTTAAPEEPDGDPVPDLSGEELSFEIDLRGILPTFRETTGYDFDCRTPEKIGNEWTATCEYRGATAWTLTLSTSDELAVGDVLKVSYDIEDAVDFGDRDGASFKWEYQDDGKWVEISRFLETDAAQKNSTYTVSDSLIETLDGAESCSFRCTITRESEEGGKVTITVIWNAKLPEADT